MHAHDPMCRLVYIKVPKREKRNTIHILGVSSNWVMEKIGTLSEKPPWLSNSTNCQITMNMSMEEITRNEVFVPIKSYRELILNNIKDKEFKACVENLGFLSYVPLRDWTNHKSPSDYMDTAYIQKDSKRGAYVIGGLKPVFEKWSPNDTHIIGLQYNYVQKRLDLILYSPN